MSPYTVPYFRVKGEDPRNLERIINPHLHEQRAWEDPLSHLSYQALGVRMFHGVLLNCALGLLFFQSY